MPFPIKPVHELSEHNEMFGGNEGIGQNVSDLQSLFLSDEINIRQAAKVKYPESTLNMLQSICESSDNLINAASNFANPQRHANNVYRVPPTINDNDLLGLKTQGLVTGSGRAVNVTDKGRLALRDKWLEEPNQFLVNRTKNKFDLRTSSSEESEKVIQAQNCLNKFMKLSSNNQNTKWEKKFIQAGIKMGLFKESHFMNRTASVNLSHLIRLAQEELSPTIIGQVNHVLQQALNNPDEDAKIEQLKSLIQNKEFINVIRAVVMKSLQDVHDKMQDNPNIKTYDKNKIDDESEKIFNEIDDKRTPSQKKREESYTGEIDMSRRDEANEEPIYLTVLLNTLNSIKTNVKDANGEIVPPVAALSYAVENFVKTRAIHKIGQEQRALQPGSVKKEVDERQRKKRKELAPGSVVEEEGNKVVPITFDSIQGMSTKSEEGGGQEIEPTGQSLTLKNKTLNFAERTEKQSELDDEMFRLAKRMKIHLDEHVHLRELFYDLQQYNALVKEYTEYDLDIQHPKRESILLIADKVQSEAKRVKNEGGYTDIINANSTNQIFQEFLSQGLITTGMAGGKDGRKPITAKEFAALWDTTRGQSRGIIPELALFIKAAQGPQSIANEINLSGLTKLVPQYLQDPNSNEGKIFEAIMRKISEVRCLQEISRKYGIKIDEISGALQSSEEKSPLMTGIVKEPAAFAYFQKSLNEEFSQREDIPEDKKTDHQNIVGTASVFSNIRKGIQTGTFAAFANKIRREYYDNRNWSKLDDEELREIAERVYNSFYGAYGRSLYGHTGSMGNMQEFKVSDYETNIKLIFDTLKNIQARSLGQDVKVFPNITKYKPGIQSEIEPEIIQEPEQQLVAAANIKRQLIRIANILDNQYLYKEANAIDTVLEKLCQNQK